VKSISVDDFDERVDCQCLRPAWRGRYLEPGSYRNEIWNGYKWNERFRLLLDSKAMIICPVIIPKLSGGTPSKTIFHKSSVSISFSFCFIAYSVIIEDIFPAISFLFGSDLSTSSDIYSHHSLTIFSTRTLQSPSTKL
jgi:hypothetical protein